MATPTKYRHPVAMNRDGMAQIGPTPFQLRGIRFADDPAGAPPAAAPPAPPAPDTPAPPAPAAPATPPAPAVPAPQPAAPAAPPAQPAPTPPAQPTPPVQYRGNPDEYVHELREEAKGHRVNFETEQAAHTETKTQLADATGQVTSLQRENFVLRNAAKHGINPDAALDSNSFMASFKDVDLADEAKVTEAFKTALEKNSTLQAGPKLPGTSGGGHQGGQPNTPTPTLQGAVAARMQG